MKKIIVALMTMVIIFLVCGCESENQEVQDTRITTLTLMKPKGMKGFEDIADGFEKDHTNVQVHIIDITDNTNERYKVCKATLSGRDSDIDIIVMDDIWMDEFVRADYLEPLKIGINKEKYEPNAIGFFSVDDTMYALPFSLDVGAVFYRRDRVGKAPESWEDVFNGSSGQPIFEGTADEDLLCAAIELGDRLYEAYPYFSKNSDSGVGELRTMFKSGETDYYRGWSRDYAYFNDYDLEIGGNVGVMIPDTSVLGGRGLAVSSFSNNKDTAIKFLSYIYDSYNLREMMKREGYIPVQKELLADEMFADYNPCMNDINKTVSRAAVRKSDSRYVETAWNLQEELCESISENREPPNLKNIYYLQK